MVAMNAGLRWFGSFDPTELRIWNGFTTARLLVAVAVLLLQGLTYAMGQGFDPAFLLLCIAYVGATLFVRAALRPRPGERLAARLWVPTVGVDLLAFAAMQSLQSGAANYTPLFGLPVLMAAVLGTRRTAWGTAAGVTLLLLADAVAFWWQVPGAAAPRFVQAGLTGIGYFLVAILVHPLAARLAREEEAARRSEHAAAVQAQVNELVIESLADGVLVIDVHDTVHAANPAARQLLGTAARAVPPPFSLRSTPVWQPLAELAGRTLAGGGRQAADVTLQYEGAGPRRLHVKTRPTPPDGQLAGGLCVMFLEDLRETEARLRTEKLAAMGRMSAAVAHEIRNPLAAIVQANQLLDEELHDPGQKQLAQLVRQNAQRLVRIAEEVLDVSRAQRRFDFDGARLVLDDSVSIVCLDWHVHAGRGCGLQWIGEAPGTVVEFDAEHLRRVLVNLLDNALRYITPHDDALQVRTWTVSGGQALLEVWSDGPPLEPTVEQRLFEPFFSSESRSSGLGLHICRELCERHGAAIGYRRIARPTGRGDLPGNAFTIAFRPPAPASGEAVFDTPQ
ncbi:ATP-binding protein [uncultured Xylophilus sp.]|uniref:two-component system sensor histidine kinase NtrB n=1 Tax=uncultured Xylophilus sp. TaxID=296832 RepID=UPI0025FB700C|nr:ATP-binding protein [uncultured Xylophilus sp.]